MAESSAPPTKTTATATIMTPSAIETEGQHVEVDLDDDNDSAIGEEDTAASTASLSSTIRNHVYENGRRYHAYQPGSYLAPNDEAENDRLDMQHHVATLVLGGKLTTAPIGKNPHQILDVGCGTGIWAIEAGDEYPSAQVLGVDLSPTQPSLVPPNVKFEVDDVEQEWTFHNPFDLIHVRFMAASISDWPKLFKQCYKHTKPGGWAEFKDWDLHIISTDNSLPQESYIYQYHKLLCDSLEQIKRPTAPGPELKKWAEQVGYVNVTERVQAMPLGTWPKEKLQKEIGAWGYIALNEGLEAGVMRMFTAVLGWSAEQVQVFLVKVREELKLIKKNKVHAQYTYYIVTGQKPEDKK